LQHIKISEIFSEVQNPIILCGVLAEESLMDNFPIILIDNIEDLKKFEKSLIDNTVNRKEL